MKKLGAVVSAVFVILAFLSIPVMYYLVEAPLLFVIVTFALLIVVAAVLLYHTRERIKEIEEGLDDAVNDY